METIGKRIGFPGAQQQMLSDEELAQQQQMAKLAALQKMATPEPQVSPNPAPAPVGEELNEDEIQRRNQAYLAQKYGNPQNR